MSNDDVKAPAPPLDITEIVSKVPKKPAPGFPSGWGIYTPEGCGLSIALPGRPEGREFKVPEAVADVMVAERGYVYHNNRLAVTADHLITSTHIPIGILTQGFVEVLQSRGLPDLKYSILQGTPTQVPIKGTFTDDGKTFSMEGFVHVSGNQTWFVTGFYETDDEGALRETRKALASAKFDSTPCGER